MQKMQERFSVITMEGVNAENAGAIFCHLIGDERFFWFATTAGKQEVRFHGWNR